MTRCENCGADEDEPHDDSCIPCPGMTVPCNNRMHQGEWGCCRIHAQYNYQEAMADREGGRI